MFRSTIHLWENQFDGHFDETNNLYFSSRNAIVTVFLTIVNINYQWVWVYENVWMLPRYMEVQIWRTQAKNVYWPKKEEARNVYQQYYIIIHAQSISGYSIVANG